MNVRELAASLTPVLPALRSLKSKNPVEIAHALTVINNTPAFDQTLAFLSGFSEAAFSLQGMGGADPSGQIGPVTDQVLPPTGPGVVQGIMRPKDVKLRGKEKEDAEKVRLAEQDQTGIDPEEQNNEGDSAPTLTEMNLIDHPIQVPTVYAPPKQPQDPSQSSSGINDDDRDYGDDQDQSASSQIQMDDGESVAPLSEMAEKYNQDPNTVKRKLQMGMSDREALGLDENQDNEQVGDQDTMSQGTAQGTNEQSAAYPNGNLDGSPPGDQLEADSQTRIDRQSAPGWNKGRQANYKNSPYGAALENDTIPLAEDPNDSPDDVARSKKLNPEEDADSINRPTMITSGEGDPKSGNREAPDGMAPFKDSETNPYIGTQKNPQSGTATTFKGKGPDNFDSEKINGLDSNLRDNALPDPEFGLDPKKWAK